MNRRVRGQLIVVLLLTTFGGFILYINIRALHDAAVLLKCSSSSLRASADNSLTDLQRSSVQRCYTEEGGHGRIAFKKTTVTYSR